VSNLCQEIYHKICFKSVIALLSIYASLQPSLLSPLWPNIIIIIIIIIIKTKQTNKQTNKKRENMHADRCGNTCRQKCCAKGSGREVKIQEFMYRDTTNVEPEMYDYTNNNWSGWNSNEKLKEKFGNCTRKTFDRFITKNSYTWNIARNTESTAV